MTSVVKEPCVTIKYRVFSFNSEALDWKLLGYNQGLRSSMHRHPKGDNNARSACMQGRSP